MNCAPVWLVAVYFFLTIGTIVLMSILVQDAIARLDRKIKP